LLDIPKKFVKRHRFWSSLFAAVAVAALLCFGLFQFFLAQPLGFSQPSMVIEIKKNQSLPAIVKALREAKVIPYPELFYWYIAARGDGRNIKAGEYQVFSDDSTKELIQRLLAGTTYFRSITFIEGWTVDQLKKELNDNPFLRHDSIKYSPKKLRNQLRIQHQSLEGMFYPDTYFFAKGTSDVVILRKAHRSMQRVLKHYWKKRAKQLPYQSPYQVLIAASLVEKETAYNGEKPLISAVIVGRLRKRMRLQIDPTVIYGMGKHYRGRLLRSDYKFKSPYNTYLNHGLPPTPIGLPSRSSISATVKPGNVNYLYYLSKGDGTHIFSRTFEQHKKAYRRYILRGN
jgi:UPF0755 protein